MSDFEWATSHTHSLSSRHQKQKMADQICYSAKYFDEEHEYR